MAPQLRGCLKSRKRQIEHEDTKTQSVYYQYILRQEAIDDLNEIWDYTFEQWSENQADKYYSTLKFACKEIG